MSRELLLKGGHVVSVDDAIGDLPKGDVLIQDDLIAAVGPDLSASSDDTEVIDVTGRLVIPGLVDTHRHVWQGAIAAYTPQITGAGYEPIVLAGISPEYTAEDIYAGTLWGALQALDAGITTIADWAHNLQSPEHADADLRGLQESGIRGYFLYGGPGPKTDEPNPPHPQDARRMRDQHFPNGVNGRLRMGLALRGPAFTSEQRNTQDFNFARELGLPISTHVGMAGTAGAITMINRNGLLGADVNYAHGNMLTDEELDLIAASKGTLSITASTRHAHAIRDIPRYRQSAGATHHLRIRRGHHLQLRHRSLLRNAARFGGRTIPSQCRGAGKRRAGADRRTPSTRHAPSRHDRRCPRLEPRT